MNATITPAGLTGAIQAPVSKSEAHRLMILAALAKGAPKIELGGTSADIEATARCLEALADDLVGTTKAQEADERAPLLLDVGESGTTLRFLLPVVGALGVECHIVRHGRLAERPLAPFDDELRAHGMQIAQDPTDPDSLMVKGTLTGGTFTLPGNVSSQFVSALLLAAPRIEGPVRVLVSKPVESRPYIDLTIGALEAFGVRVCTQDVTHDGRAFEQLTVEEGPLVAPGCLVPAGDWSNAAFWLAAGSWEPEGLTVSGLDMASRQGDRQILAALSLMGARVARLRDAARVTLDHPRAVRMDVSAIPDLVMPLAAAALACPGETVLTGAARLALKESDRLATTVAAIRALGGSATCTADELRVTGGAPLPGGVVDAAGDHRIAMMAAVLATRATGPSTILGAECVEKSYPTFFDDLRVLGGQVTLA